MMVSGITAVGFVVGLLVGLTGMGGGLLMTPLLILLYGFSPTMAVGTDLVYAAITKAAGTWQHVRQRTWDADVVKRLAKGSIPGGMAGVLSIRVAEKILPFPVEEGLGHVMGFTFCTVAVWMVIRQTRGKKREPVLGGVPLEVAGFWGGFLVGRRE